MRIVGERCIKMSGLDDLIRKAAQIAEEEGLFENDRNEVLMQEMLPRPEKVNQQEKALATIMERLKDETGFDVNQAKGALESISPEQVQDAVQSGHQTTDHAVEASDNTQNISSGSQSEKNMVYEKLKPKPEDFIQKQLDVLEEWTNQNLQLAKKDSIRFWILKIPAIICSVSVTAFEFFDYGQINIILGVVAAFCIAVDAAFPGGQMHNAHKRAANEARRLQHNAIGKWQKAQLDKNTSREESARTIIDYIQRERTRIDKYVTDAETSLGIQSS